MNQLLNTIMALAHDGFEVAFQDEGYNCNLIILRYKEKGQAKERPVERRVALPESHLNEQDVAHYLKVMRLDPIFPQ